MSIQIRSKYTLNKIHNHVHNNYDRDVLKSNTTIFFIHLNTMPSDFMFTLISILNYVIVCLSWH